ncbi:unnamed protein product [Saccharomyces cerevisiae]|nr:unnamed protein product [Saccharomyces cerevisiae]
MNNVKRNDTVSTFASISTATATATTTATTTATMTAVTTQHAIYSANSYSLNKTFIDNTIDQYFESKLRSIESTVGTDMQEKFKSYTDDILDNKQKLINDQISLETELIKEVLEVNNTIFNELLTKSQLINDTWNEISEDAMTIDKDSISQMASNLLLNYCMFDSIFGNYSRKLKSLQNFNGTITDFSTQLDASSTLSLNFLRNSTDWLQLKRNFTANLQNEISILSGGSTEVTSSTSIIKRSLKTNSEENSALSAVKNHVFRKCKRMTIIFTVMYFAFVILLMAIERILFQLENQQIVTRLTNFEVPSLPTFHKRAGPSLYKREVWTDGNITTTIEGFINDSVSLLCENFQTEVDEKFITADLSLQTDPNLKVQSTDILNLWVNDTNTQFEKYLNESSQNWQGIDLQVEPLLGSDSINEFLGQYFLPTYEVTNTNSSFALDIQKYGIINRGINITNASSIDMAHRKLQQEVDRVFKKINEGLEIFNSYYERHESCTNNPSQKDKLESDLKREVKKLQRLREQIKSWQSSPDIKDKDSLLDYRRSVEIAMEKYKAVEKASKEKAYSNISLKKSETLDPQERERRDISEYLSQMIDELERQYDSLQVEIDKLLLLNKKKKTSSTTNDEKKEQYKRFQARYRWHQQQMELALRLLANEELDPQDVKNVQDDINYFVESNQDPDFVEDETIYDGLNLQSNEAIAHEVAQYFASQNAEDNNTSDANESLQDISKLSKKEQRKLEREAKKAAKLAAKNATGAAIPVAGPSSTPSPVIPVADASKETERSPSSSPIHNATKPEEAVKTSIKSPRSSADNLLPSLQKSPSSATPETPTNVHTHIHQTPNGITGATTLKPATLPAKPAGELKWAVAASQAVEKDRKVTSASSTISNTSTKTPTTAAATTTSSNANSRIGSALNTPKFSTSSLSLQPDNTGASSSAATAAAVLAAGAAAVHQNNQAFYRNMSSSHHPLVSLATNPKSEHEVATTVNQNGPENTTKKVMEQKEEESPEERNKLQVPTFGVFDDDFESDRDSETEPEEEEQPSTPKYLSLEQREAKTNEIKKEFVSDFETLLLPSGVQEFIMSSELYNSQIESKITYKRSRDMCEISRLVEVPQGVNPPSPLDAFRSTQQWDVMRCSLRDIIIGSERLKEDSSSIYAKILENFRTLEMFSLFYNYYFAITPLEREIAYKILNERDWKVSKDGTMWFLRQGEVKFFNEICEVGDYKIFKLDDWTVIDKINFRLDYSFLQPPVDTASEVRDMSVDNNNVNDQSNVTLEQQKQEISHGKQLLKQLKQGKISV